MKKRIFNLLGVLLLGCVALSCAKMEDKATNSDNASVAEISGIVKDESGNGLVDVLVQVEDRSEHIYTNSKGEFKLYLRPRSDTSHTWKEDVNLFFVKAGYTKYNDASGTDLTTPRTLTIERGRTSVIVVSIKPS